MGRYDILQNPACIKAHFSSTTRHRTSAPTLSFSLRSSRSRVCQLRPSLTLDATVCRACARSGVTGATLRVQVSDLGLLATRKYNQVLQFRNLTKFCSGSSLVDAFVWVKPGGESDGTSDTSATRYDSFCGLEDAFKPSPEAGGKLPDPVS
jgi:hypothetical protein